MLTPTTLVITAIFTFLSPPLSSIDGLLGLPSFEECQMYHVTIVWAVAVGVCLGPALAHPPPYVSS